MILNLLDIIIGLPILIFSVVFHEVAHGFVADKLGDPTARLYGRLTLNPLKHIDPIMTILLPLVLILTGSPIVFGAAKPVPVDAYNLREGRKDVSLVSLAGPLTNILLAILGTILLKLSMTFLPETPYLLQQIFFMVVTYNVALAIFNLIPVPPLDGSKVFASLLPEHLANAYLAIGTSGFAGLIAIYVLLFLFGPFISSVNTFALHLLGF